MLSALLLLRHAAGPGAVGFDGDAARRARAMADYLQLYNPSALVAAPEPVCAGTLAPLAGRLGLGVEDDPHLSADPPKFPGGAGPAAAAAWFAARALRALPDARRTAVVCAESVVVTALLVAVAARDGHDLSGYDFDLPLDGRPALAPGGGWVLHRDDGRLAEVKPLAPVEAAT